MFSLSTLFITYEYPPLFTHTLAMCGFGQLLNPVPQAPTADELGYVKSIVVEEIGGTMCTVFRQDASLGSIASIVLRGSSDSFLDDVERAIDDGVNAFKVGVATVLPSCCLTVLCVLW